MYEATFDPPTQLNGITLPELPAAITTRREAVAVFERLPACGIHWCGVAACLENFQDIAKLRLALATAPERYGFLDPGDVDTCGRWQ